MPNLFGFTEGKSTNSILLLGQLTHYYMLRGNDGRTRCMPLADSRLVQVAVIKSMNDPEMTQVDRFVPQTFVKEALRQMMHQLSE